MSFGKNMKRGKMRKKKEGKGKGNSVMGSKKIK
jgi:hypothetical protein